MTASLDRLAARQGVHQVFGLCCPFWTRKPVDGRPNESMQYVPGAATVAIRQGRIDLQLEYVFYEFLADSRHGLSLFETPSGIAFEAALPDTPFVRAIVAAIEARRLRHVCCIGTIQTRPSGELGLWNVTVFDLTTVNLLVASAPCFPETWVTTSRLEFRRRLAITDDQVSAWMRGQLEAPVPAGVA